MPGWSRLGRQYSARHVRSTWWRLALHGLPAPDVVLVHGAGAWPLTDVIGTDVPVILHLHELEAALERCIAPAQWRAVFGRCRRVLAVADGVASLAAEHGARTATRSSSCRA